MTQDEVLKELSDVIAGNQQFTTWTVSTPHLVELVNRAVNAEREACAKVCDDIHANYEAEDVFSSYAEAIRARGEQA
jgi:predicted oxidoreductase